MEDQEKAKKEEILKTIKPEWKKQKKRWGHSLHTMCTYMASFPASIPRYFIDTFTQEGDIVFDPFSGKGTTPAEAILCKRKGVGNDLNPLAYVLTSAKMHVPGIKDSFDRIDQLEKLWKESEKNIDISKEPDKIKMIFHDKTLSQLVFLKNYLKWKQNNGNDQDIFLTGCLMGIIHGGSRGFLSISMPNTFSMSPGYIKKYIGEKNLIREERDVFGLLKEKIERMLKDGEINLNGTAYLGDARKVDLKDNSVKLVVSSPPYLKVIKYGMYNWIRLWFLDEEPKSVDDRLDDAHALPEYLNFMDEVLKETYRLLEDGGLVVYLIGDVNKKDTSINLAKEVWNYSGEKIGFKLLDIMADDIADNMKLTRLWNEKRGKSTPTDRLLIIYKGDVPKIYKKEVSWDVRCC